MNELPLEPNYTNQSLFLALAAVHDDIISGDDISEERVISIF
jgi:hypothetical protein